MPLKPVEQLKSEVKRILEETNTPTAGIALVDKDGPIWIDGIENDNLKDNFKANANTIFRTASVSKILVALAILKLEDTGKLNINDKIRDIAPEIKFENKWEETNPVRILHLLNHTTGWDEIHPPEMAHNTSIPINLKDALDFHPHSRISRWIPGTRPAYSNAGYAVAAYIIEKVSNMSYEEFVKSNILDPLNMRSTTFFNDSIFKSQGVINYDKNLKIVPYRNVIFRAAAAMNSSPSDMANLLLLLLHRGSLNGHQLLSETSIIKMQMPLGTSGANAGLALGYSLGSSTSIHNGFIYHGHNGTLDGGLCEFAYLPEYGVGHVIFLNATKPDAFFRISKLIRDFETNQFLRSFKTKPAPLNSIAEFNNGFYIPINPRNQATYFMDCLIGIEKIELRANTITKSWIFPSGGKEKFVPITDSTFAVENTDRIGMVKTMDPLAGEVLHTDKLVLKQISTFQVYGQLSLLLMWILMAVVGLGIFLFSTLYSLIKYKSMTDVLRLQGLTTLHTISILVLLFLLNYGYSDYDNSIAKPSVISISLLLVSLLIIMTGVATLFTAFKKIKSAKIPVYFVRVLSILQFFMIVYLISFGVLPFISWV